MDKETYYIELQSLIDKVTELKKVLNASNDREKSEYLKLAIDSTYEEIRKLMEIGKKY